MTRDELHYLADHVNDEMFDRIRALREQVKVLSEEKIHTDRRINNQRKELKRKDERIKGLQEIIEDILDGAEGATVATEPTDVDAQFDPQKIVAEAVSRFTTKYAAPDARDRRQKLIGAAEWLEANNERLDTMNRADVEQEAAKLRQEAEGK